jgi:hypothetical protein
MKKLLSAVFFVVLSAIVSSVPAVAAGPNQPTPVPTVNVTPNFLDTWTLGFSGGRIVDTNGMRQEFPYSELVANISSTQSNEGTVSYSGAVSGSSGSSVNVFYQFATPRYVDVYLYIPQPSLGSGNQYFLQVTLRMFVSSDGNYAYGTMGAAFYDNLNGRSATTILYHSDVFMSRAGARG